MRRRRAQGWRLALLAPIGLAGLAIGALAGASHYYGGAEGEGCGRCHEIRPSAERWASSSHRNVACGDCHGRTLSTDLRMHWKSASRLWKHVRGEVPEQIRLGHREMGPLLARCAACHARENADWSTGPHGVPYREIFLDQEHNRRRQLIDDCLRCHGMHFDGGIQDVVAPLDREGPWRLVGAGLADQPAIPCVACHAVHSEGEPLGPRAVRLDRSGLDQPVAVSSLALYDRRALDHVAVANLPLPTVTERGRRVRTSPDERQALCYQCHAPLASAEAFSGDDRTPTGVHEGLSCLACHASHGQTTRASCAGCHPRLSNCGVDVETMDTTFRSPESRHDVHRVACADCHPDRVPRPGRASAR